MISKSFIIITLLLSLASCAIMVRMHPSNITEENLLSISNGMNTAEVFMNLGPPMKTHMFTPEQSKSYGVSYAAIYPRDTQQGTNFRCQNVIILFSEDNNGNKGVVKILRAKPDDNRCQRYANNYDMRSLQQRADMQYLGNSLSSNIKSTSPSDNQCVGDMSCGLGQKCAKQKNQYYGICVDMYYIDE